MFLDRTDVTCLTLPLYSTPVNTETSFWSFVNILYGSSLLNKAFVAIFLLVGFCSCSEIPEPNSHNQVSEVFGNMEEEGQFWQQIDTIHLLIASERYAQAKARILKVRKSIDKDAQLAIVKTISRKIDFLQRENGDKLLASQNQANLLDPYLQSTSTADLMLAYNLATGYIREMAEKLGSIKFPGALAKRKHIVFYEGMYRIRSYATIYTTSGQEVKSRFNCDIKLHKDRRNFTIHSLEIRK